MLGRSPSRSFAESNSLQRTESESRDTRAMAMTHCVARTYTIHSALYVALQPRMLSRGDQSRRLFAVPCAPVPFYSGLLHMLNMAHCRFFHAPISIVAYGGCVVVFGAVRASLLPLRSPIRSAVLLRPIVSAFLQCARVHMLSLCNVV